MAQRSTGATVQLVAGVVLVVFLLGAALLLVLFSDGPNTGEALAAILSALALLVPTVVNLLKTDRVEQQVKEVRSMANGELREAAINEARNAARATAVTVAESEVRKFVAGPGEDEAPRG